MFMAITLSVMQALDVARLRLTACAERTGLRNTVSM
jgi:hypothetical protein